MKADNTAEIINQSVEGFDLTDKITDEIVKEFREAHLSKNTSDVLHNLQSPEAIDAVIVANKAKIKVRIAVSYEFLYPV